MPTTARLIYWVYPHQREAFEATHAELVTPILERHGLRASTAAASLCATPEHKGWTFTQAFQVDSPAELTRLRAALFADSEWQQLVSPADESEPPFHGCDLRAQRVTGVTGRRATATPGHTVPAGPGTSVRPGVGHQQGLWHSLGPADGMPACASSMVQDRTGDLWLATCAPGYGGGGQGLCRYDGGRLRRFTTADGLPHDDVTCVLEGRAGDLWIGTAGGLVRHDGHTFTTWTTADGLVDDRVCCLLIDQSGRLWIGTLGGLCRYDGEAFTHLTVADGLVNDRVTCMVEDTNGELWFGAGWQVPVEVGVSRYDGETLTNYLRIDGLLSDWVLSLLVDRSGTLWLGHNSGVSTWDGAAFRVASHTDTRQFIGGVTAMVEDRAGRLWCAVWGQGLRRLDEGDPVEITAQEGLITEEVVSLLEDRDGQLWVGTGSAGISRFLGGQLQVYTTGEGLADTYVCALVEDRQGRLWIGTRGGMSWHDGGQIGALAEAGSGLASPILVDSRDRIWIGLQGRGVGCWDGGRFELFAPAPTVPWWVKTIPLLEDRDGALWFCTNGQGGGLSRLEAERWLPFEADVGLAPESVRCMLQDRHGRLWFGGEGGLSCYDGERAITFGTADGLAGVAVEVLVEDRAGRLWIGTRGGLSRYDGRDLTTWTTADGLVNDHVTAILEDDGGRLWIGSLGGVCRFDGVVFQHLSRKDGLPHPHVLDLHPHREGGVWMATGRGLVRHAPASSSPRVVLRSVVADQTHEPVAPISIPASQRVVAFEFEAKSLTTLPEHMAFAARLEGHDTDWRPVYAGRVQYRDLPIGEYRFQVRAVDRDLNTSDTAEVAVTVEPDLLVESLTATLRESGPGGDFIGSSAALGHVLQQLRQVAPAELTVLIQGETGTGKGLAARSLHELSPRRRGPFIQVNCGAIPEPLIEAELFGHERGAFTGAIGRRLGKVELAGGGTLFLDEIADMPLTAQGKLLRLLEERTFERVGSAAVLSADVRVVAATNRDLRQMVAAQTFREDLYFRLLGFELRLPPLRERREDIPLLALYFVGPRAAHLGKEVAGLSHAAEAALVAHAWPGNVRELQHAVERAVVVCRGPTIQAEDLALGESSRPSRGPEHLTLEEVERRHIRAVLEDAGWLVAGPRGAATALGLKESTLRARMKKLGIERP